MTRKLRAQAGTDECNFGALRMPVDTDGTVTVPDEAVASLLATGGFVTVEGPVDVPTGFVLAVNSAGVDSASWGGENYEPDAKGLFTVPAAAMADLIHHGFAQAPDGATPAPPDPAAPVIPTLTPTAKA